MAVIACLTLMGMVPEVASTRYIVGGNRGWSPGNNYTIWAQDKHFHTDDWLFFVYDRNQQNILEVNKTDYEACNSDHPVHNWTTGAGRDVVPLNVTRHYYFLSGKGFCFSGMKMAVHVEKAPPPPSASPVKSDSSRFTLGGQLVIPAVIAIGAVWDTFLRVFKISVK